MDKAERRYVVRRNDGGRTRTSWSVVDIITTDVVIYTSTQAEASLARWALVTAWRQGAQAVKAGEVIL